jgi:hypothetical protein
VHEKALADNDHAADGEKKKNGGGSNMHVQALGPEVRVPVNVDIPRCCFLCSEGSESGCLQRTRRHAASLVQEQRSRLNTQS